MTQLEELITNEFRSGYLYLSMAEKDTKYSDLAREKIESGMRFFDEYISPPNQSCK